MINIFIKERNVGKKNDLKLYKNEEEVKHNEEQKRSRAEIEDYIQYSFNKKKPNYAIPYGKNIFGYINLNNI